MPARKSLIGKRSGAAAELVAALTKPEVRETRVTIFDAAKDAIGERVVDA